MRDVAPADRKSQRCGSELADNDAALAQLKDEGRTITGPHPNRLSTKQDPRQGIYGYRKLFNFSPMR
jgi:hypothetical protein